MTPLKSQAIQTALMGDWNSAIIFNRQLLEESPNDIDTLNRLAYACLSAGDVKEAKNLYQKVLTLDMKNPIALKNLKRLSDTDFKRSNVQLNNLFIEEPGKTKVVELINIADKKLISPLRSGEYLNMCIKRMKIFVLDSDEKYIGMLPDDIGKRLIKFINGGNKYEAYVRTVGNNRITIFIRELKRVKRYKDQPSFISTDKVKLSLENNTLSIKAQNNTKQKVNEDIDEKESQPEEEESL